jgi:hypothetical protein
MPLWQSRGTKGSALPITLLHKGGPGILQKTASVRHRQLTTVGLAVVSGCVAQLLKSC